MDGVEMMDQHEYRYGDPRRVAGARKQAEGSIALRKLRETLLDSWAVPLVNRLSRRLESLFRT